MQIRDTRLEAGIAAEVRRLAANIDVSEAAAGDSQQLATRHAEEAARGDSLVREASGEVERAYQQFEQLQNDFAKDKIFYQGGIAAGVGITIIGLTAWFYRFQRLQDELLRLQVEAARRDASHATPS